MVARRRRTHIVKVTVPAILGLVLLAYHAVPNFTLPPRSRQPSSDKSANSVAHSPLCAPVAATALGLLAAFTGSVSPADALAIGPWTYKDKGLDWGADFPGCDAKKQSPIDIREVDVDEPITYKNNAELLRRSASMLRFINYVPVETEMRNNMGKNLQANGNFGSVRLPDGTYEAKQFHFHFPAEHTMEGFRAAGELHIVHQKRGSTEDRDIAIFAITIKQDDASEGPEGEWMKQIGFGSTGFGSGFPNNPGDKAKIGVTSLTAFNSQFGAGYYHYVGSLSAPPCTESVHWYVFKRSAPITTRMIKTFRDRFQPNARSPRPRNGRQIASTALTVMGEY